MPGRLVEGSFVAFPRESLPGRNSAVLSPVWGNYLPFSFLAVGISSPWLVFPCVYKIKRENIKDEKL